MDKAFTERGETGAGARFGRRGKEFIEHVLDTLNLKNHRGMLGTSQVQCFNA